MTNRENGRGSPLRRLSLKLSNFSKIQWSELCVLENVYTKHRNFKAGETLIEQGEPFASTYLVTAGWAMRYRVLENGKRQVVNFILPGDFSCLNALHYTHASRTVMALSDLNVLVYQPKTLGLVIQQNYRFAAALLWLDAQESSIITERLVSLGRRNAYQRTAHLLLELYYRLNRVGLAAGLEYDAPLRLEILADTLGLTPIHVSRTVQCLRKDGLFRVDFRNNMTVRILNEAACRRAAQFDAEYLRLGT